MPSRSLLAWYARFERALRLAMREFAAPLLSREPLAHFASPAGFHALAGRLVPWFALAALLLTMAGLAIALVSAPAGTLGDAYRVVIVHVPAAWMSLLLYLVMAGCAALTVLLNARLPGLMMTALAPTGAIFTFVALYSGSVWGWSTWGAWWVWDARLTCELILLLLFIAVIALRSRLNDPLRGERAGGVLVLVGVLNIPIIYFSLRWWNTLHQGVASSLTGSPGMGRAMLWGMLVMALGFGLYSMAVILSRVRCLMLERHGQPGDQAGEAAA
jgi:heme exporter protein C